MNTNTPFRTAEAAPPSRGARAPIPTRATLGGARAPVLDLSSRPAARAAKSPDAEPVDPRSRATQAREVGSRPVRAACGLASSLFLGLPGAFSRRSRSAAGGDVSSDGSGLVLPVNLLFLAGVAMFAKTGRTVFLAAAAVFGVLAVPLQALWSFQSLDDGSFGRSRVYQFVFEGAFFAVVLSFLIGSSLGTGILSPGPCWRTFWEEIAMIVILAILIRRNGAVRANGLLAGAALGAGVWAFSALESMILLGSSGAEATFFSFVRHLPFGHVACTAILGAALSILFGERSSGSASASAILGALLLLSFPICIRLLWVGDIGISWFIKYLLLGTALWTVALILLVVRLYRHPEILPSLLSEPRSSSRDGSSLFGLLTFAAVTFFTGFFLTAGGIFFTRVVAPRIGL